MQIPDASSGPVLPKAVEEYRGRTDPEALKAVAQEMEAMFAYELLKAMREASNTSAKGGLGANTYNSLFDMELSRLIAKRGLGVQDMLLRGLEKKTSADAKKVENSTKSTNSIEKAGSSTAHDDLDSAAINVLPVSGGKISSGYGMRRDPFTGTVKFHHGMDVAAPEGSEINPIKPGKVIFSGSKDGYGNMVIIDHGDGFVTKYAHNQTNLVEEGDTVSTNTVLARVGSTGRSTGPHTHFEVSYNGKDLDPAAILAKNI